MLSADDNKPIGKPGQRKRNAGQEGRKSEARRRKSAQVQQPQPDEVQAAAAEAEAVGVPSDPAPEAVSELIAPSPEAASEPSAVALEAVSEPFAPALEAASEPSAPVPEAIIEPAIIEPSAATSAALTVLADSSAIVPIASAEIVPISFRTIANAYCSYTLQSLDRTRCFFEDLAGARSLTQALELEVEFARQTYEGFVTESQKICELHGELLSQRLRRWEGFVARMIPLH